MGKRQKGKGWWGKRGRRRRGKRKKLKRGREEKGREGQEKEGERGRREGKKSNEGDDSTSCGTGKERSGVTRGRKEAKRKKEKKKKSIYTFFRYPNTQNFFYKFKL